MRELTLWCLYFHEFNLEFNHRFPSALGEVPVNNETPIITSSISTIITKPTSCGPVNTVCSSPFCSGRLVGCKWCRGCCSSCCRASSILLEAQRYMHNYLLTGLGFEVWVFPNFQKGANFFFMVLFLKLSINPLSIYD